MMASLICKAIDCNLVENVTVSCLASRVPLAGPVRAPGRIDDGEGAIDPD
jgi:hypothetical protein